jgi:hypothetical protein
VTGRRRREIAELFVDVGRECVECAKPTRFEGEVLCRDCDRLFASSFPAVAIASRIWTPSLGGDAPPSARTKERRARSRSTTC